MSRIAQTFARRRAEGRKLLVSFFTAGDPNPDATIPLMHEVVRAGVDIIELGVPFSDPMAEGPVIQAACERALLHHVSLQRVLDMVREFRIHDPHTPVVLMGYANPVETMGYVRFAEAAAVAGVDGVITVDLPPDEGRELNQALTSRGIDPVLLVAPTTTPARLQQICAAARGFIYYVSLKGVTGAATLDVADVADKIQEIRKATTLPIGVGFGIHDAKSAAAVAQVADAVVVGSALVRLVERHQDDTYKMREAMADLVADLRRAIDSLESARA
ncbi:MAG TPA: tryptophan synthase subunit alpha [Gammaproteobacteria bacterium]|nr:tryptophan synthase subunit alpha [Gammaproteobacteria bacterium]